MATEPIQAGPYPVPGDPPDGPNQMSAITTWAAGRLNMRFASTAARDAAIPAPTEGMECTTGTGTALAKWFYLNGAWVRVSLGTDGVPTLGTGWSEIGAPYVAMKAHREASGLTTVQAVLRRTGATITGGNSGTMLILPAGFRPQGTMYFFCTRDLAGVSLIADSAGTVAAEAPANWTSGSSYVSIMLTFIGA